jgi:hypothetical protein
LKNVQHNPHTVTFIKTQREFCEAFFSAKYFRLTKTNKGQVFDRVEFSQLNQIETYNYLYLLGSKKRKFYLFIMVYRGKKIPGHTRSQNFGQKIRKIKHF